MIIFKTEKEYQNDLKEARQCFKDQLDDIRKAVNHEPQGFDKPDKDTYCRIVKKVNKDGDGDGDVTWQVQYRDSDDDTKWLNSSSDWGMPVGFTYLWEAEEYIQNRMDHRPQEGDEIIYY